MKSAVIYARVSTSEQTPENQLISLRQSAERQGFRIVHEFIDHGVSGAKSASDRPALAALLKGVSRKEFEVVMAWDVSRLGRSLQDLVAILQEIQAKGIDLYLHQQGIDTATPSGKMMFQMCGVFAEFERGMIRERVLAGQERAKRVGKRIGRPTNVTAESREKARFLRHLGWGICRIAKHLRVGTSTVEELLPIYCK